MIPAFLEEAHFNAQSYSLDFVRTPERRELDYVRQTAASVETAKEVKIFGLNGFLIDRYVRLATDFYAANRRLAIRRAGWGGLFTAIGTVGYYLAYAGTRKKWRKVDGAPLPAVSAAVFPPAMNSPSPALSILASPPSETSGNSSNCKLLAIDSSLPTYPMPIC